MLAFSFLDGIAFFWFVLCWVVYTRFADHTCWRKHSVTAAMSDYRRRWMHEMLHREIRMVDTAIQTALLNGVAFFASTTILLVGGLIAMLGATDKAIEVLKDLPFALDPARDTWEIKMLLMVIIFIHAFFKFVWAYRLFNYCTILIGATPAADRADAKAQIHADRIADLHSLGARHFNSGLRAYSFALGALGWFIHPIIFIMATALVTMVLYRREFRSRSLKLLTNEPHELKSTN